MQRKGHWNVVTCNSVEARMWPAGTVTWGKGAIILLANELHVWAVIFFFFFGLLLMFLYLLSETLQHSWSSCFKSFFKLEMDLKIKNQPIARAGGQSEEAYGMTSVSQKYKGGKSLGITQTYELNQWTICLVRNKKKPSAKIFLVRGTARAKIIFYGGKLHVNGICKNDFWKDSRNISFKCQWCAISQ